MSGPQPDPGTQPARKGDGCVLAILMVVGIGLLVPGLCAAVFALAVADKLFRDLFSDARIAVLWFLSVAAGAAGVFLLARARRMAGYPDRRDAA
jgi:hypothetical protein